MSGKICPKMEFKPPFHPSQLGTGEYAIKLSLKILPKRGS